MLGTCVSVCTRNYATMGTIRCSVGPQLEYKVRREWLFVGGDSCNPNIKLCLDTLDTSCSAGVVTKLRTPLPNTRLFGVITPLQTHLESLAIATGEQSQGAGPGGLFIAMSSGMFPETTSWPSPSTVDV
eukprot:scaffold96206_cov14-Tisochrysis_lutea.AAC.1